MGEEKPKKKPTRKNNKNSPYKGKGSGSNPNSKKHLIPNRGQGVPNAGRAGSLNVKTRLASLLEHELSLKMPDGKPIKDARLLDSILVSMIQQAIKGNTKAAALVLDRAYGKEETAIKVAVEGEEEYSQRLRDAHERMADIIDAIPGVDFKEEKNNK